MAFRCAPHLIATGRRKKRPTATPCAGATVATPPTVAHFRRPSPVLAAYAFTCAVPAHCSHGVSYCLDAGAPPSTLLCSQTYGLADIGGCAQANGGCDWRRIHGCFDTEPNGCPSPPPFYPPSSPPGLPPQPPIHPPPSHPPCTPPPLPPPSSPPAPPLAPPISEVYAQLAALAARVSALEEQNVCLRAQLTAGLNGEDVCAVTLVSSTSATHIQLGGDGLAQLSLTTLE